MNLIGYPDIGCKSVSEILPFVAYLSGNFSQCTLETRPRQLRTRLGLATNSHRPGDAVPLQQITSAIVHPHCVYLEQSEGLFSAGSILGERLPEEDVRVVETADNPHQQDVPVLPGAQRRKLYFNPAYFDRQLLLVSPLRAEEAANGQQGAYFRFARVIRASLAFSRSRNVLMTPSRSTCKVYCLFAARSNSLGRRQDNLKTARRFLRPHLRLPSSSCSKSEKSSPSPSTRWQRRDSFLLSPVSARTRLETVKSRERFDAGRAVRILENTRTSNDINISFHSRDINVKNRETTGRHESSVSRLGSLYFQTRIRIRGFSTVYLACRVPGSFRFASTAPQILVAESVLKLELQRDAKVNQSRRLLSLGIIRHN